MKGIINKSRSLLILFVFIISGCSIKKEINFDDNKLIYKDTFYSMDDKYLPIRCEGDKVKIDKIYSLLGTYEYFISSLDENNNIIYDGRNQWLKDGFVLPDDNKDNISRIYISMSFKGSFDEELMETDVIQFDNLDEVYLDDIVEECPIDEVKIHNNHSFWLFIIYSNYEYMSIQYNIYHINNEIYFTKYSDNEHLYKVNNNYKKYFEESIIKLLE